VRLLKDRATRDAEKRKKDEHEQQLRQKASAKLDITRGKRDSRVRFRPRADVATSEKPLVRVGQSIKWLGLIAWTGLIWLAYSSAILYRKLDIKHPLFVEFLLFWMISNLVTVLQLVAMPIVKSWFSSTGLIDMDFQILRIGSNVDGTPYYIFDYAAGFLSGGGGGGLAYFLAVEVVLIFAQVINFPLQRNIAFKSKGNPWFQAFWFFIAFVGVTLFAGAAQGLYKTPLYNLLIHTWSMGETGETIADIVSMFAYVIVAFWVFFPIFKIIFPRAKASVDGAPQGSSHQATGGAHRQ
jgi:putative flippase GtrA